MEGREELPWKSAVPLGELVDEAEVGGDWAVRVDVMSPQSRGHKGAESEDRQISRDSSAQGCSVTCDTF